MFQFHLLMLEFTHLRLEAAATCRARSDFAAFGKSLVAISCANAVPDAANYSALEISRGNFGLHGKRRCLISEAILFYSHLLPVNHQPSRKQFFAKLFGSAAALSVLPKLSAQSPATALAAAPANETVAPVVIRSDARAVARRADTV